MNYSENIFDYLKEFINKTVHSYGRGKISYLLNRSPREYLGVIHSMLLSVFLSKTNIIPLLDELPQEIISYFITERSRDISVGIATG
jgi:hypothetical protein